MKTQIFLIIIAIIIGLIGWIWLFLISWKIALAVFFVLWSKNITEKIDNKK